MGEPTAEDRDALLARYDDIKNAIKTKDVDAFLALMAVDSPGRAALAEQLRGQFGEIVGAPYVRFEVEDLLVDGDVASVTYRETGHRVVDRDGARHTVEQVGRERMLWHRTGDGWLFDDSEFVDPFVVRLDGPVEEVEGVGRELLAEYDRIETAVREKDEITEFWIDIEDLQVDGDFAVLTYVEGMTLVVCAAGVREERRTRRTERATWRRTPDGWRQTGREHLDGDLRP